MFERIGKCQMDLLASDKVEVRDVVVDLVGDVGGVHDG